MGLLWEVEEFFLFVFAGAGFLGGFVGVALVAEDAEVVGVVCSALAYWGDVVYFVSWLSALLAGVVVVGLPANRGHVVKPLRG